MCILPQLNKCQGTEGDEELCSRQREQCVQKLGNEKEICISLRSFSYQEQRREGIRSFLSFPWIQSLPWGGSEIAQVCLWHFTTSLLILFFSSLFFHLANIFLFIQALQCTTTTRNVSTLKAPLIPKFANLLSIPSEFLVTQGSCSHQVVTGQLPD